MLAELSEGPRPAKAVEAAANALGIKKRTLDRARRQARVVTTKDGPGGTWLLQLGEEAVDA